MILRYACLCISVLVIMVGCSREKDSGSGTDPDLLPTSLINNPYSEDEMISASEKVPELQFVSDDIDFGEVVAGEMVKAEFKFINSGSADLIITAVLPDCGCTVPSYKEEPVAPGETGTIEILFDTKEKYGEQTRLITVEANVPEVKHVLFLKGLVLRNAADITESDSNIFEPTDPEMPSIVFAEDEYDFGTIKEGESVSHDFSFKNIGRLPLTILEATADCGCTIPTYSRSPIIGDDTGQLHVVFNSKGKLGQQRKAIRIQTNGVPRGVIVYMAGVVIAAD